MDKQEAVALVTRSLPKFTTAGLPPLGADAIAAVQPKRIASLWAGMGNVWQLNITTSTAGAPPLSIVAKRVELPAVCSSIGDQRKKDSYDVEASFYSRGHAERLIAAGAVVPFPLHVEHRPGEGVTICMTRVEGRSSHRGDSEAFVAWLAKLHATFWGRRADEACGGGAGGGLQAQGCYWHLDTRPEEHARMGSSGWMGRLRLAARAIDLRLKADPLQVRPNVHRHSHCRAPAPRPAPCTAILTAECTTVCTAECTAECTAVCIAVCTITCIAMCVAVHLPR